ncbi:MAG: alpha/beta hydrolase [Pseudomonadales bacterium]|jgi:lipase|nr:alpha/beta hydrolase [Pseudomonadales bacterium]
MEAIEKNAVVNGTRITYFERGIAYRGQGPTLLFVHATGFHARVWDKIIDALGDLHSISVDQRGHGRSEKKKIQHWDEVITDVAELIEQLDLTNILAIGHSMGGHALIGAAARMEDRFHRIVAIDPVIPPEDAYHDETPSPFSGAEEHPTAKRRNEFDSPEEMADRLRPKGSYGLFHPDMLMDYCRYGLLPNPKGKGYILACPPEVEASVYMSSRSNAEIYRAVHQLSIPVLILRAKEPAPDRNIMDFSSSPTWPKLVDEFKNGREIYFADHTHFLPMEIPEQVTQIIQDEIDAINED